MEFVILIWIGLMSQYKIILSIIWQYTMTHKRLGKITWSVVHVISEDSPPKALGLFWGKDMAIQFAESCA